MRQRHRLRPRAAIRHAAALLPAFFSAPLLAATDVAVCTDLGRMTFELDNENAPQHAANFLAYVDQGFYSGTVFHRVIDGFVVQGGGFDRELEQKPTRAPVPNESQNGVANARGTIAAARTSDPDSATSQFYINLGDNASLNASARGPGYTVFGRVSEGMDVVDRIAKLPTGAAGPFGSDVPEPLVAVTSMTRLDEEAAEAGGEAFESEIADAIEAGRYVDALEAVDGLRATCAEMGPDLLLTEARIATGLLRAPRARAVLDEYFAVADDEHSGYAEATSMRDLLNAPAP